MLELSAVSLRTWLARKSIKAVGSSCLEEAPFCSQSPDPTGRAPPLLSSCVGQHSQRPQACLEPFFAVGHAN